MVEFGGINTELGNNAPFLISLNDSNDNILKLLIAGSQIGDKGTNFDECDNEKINFILNDSYLLEPNKFNMYEIVFDNYIMYENRNDSFYSGDSEEIFYGNYLRIYEKSKLLSCLERITDAQKFSDSDEYYPGKWTHYGVCTQNHIIDIVSLSIPIISKCEVC